LTPLIPFHSGAIIFPMPKETVTQVSSADFAKKPLQYLAEVQPGRVVEVTAPSEAMGQSAFVILSKEDFDGYRATAELLSHPEDRKALLKSLGELGSGHAKE
jgi:PHD/YefM family antitoxin component YafN of YafNO toxin-antitoxin module